MSKRAVRDPAHAHQDGFWSTSPSAWTDPDDALAQHARCQALRQGVNVNGQTHGPYTADGATQYGLLQLRCGAPGCRAPVGAVWVVDRLWQGQPFTYAETLRVTDRTGKPLSRALDYLLDAVTATAMLRSECSQHRIVAVPVREVLALRLEAIDRLRAGKKPGSLAMAPDPDVPDRAASGCPSVREADEAFDDQTWARTFLQQFGFDAHDV